MPVPHVTFVCVHNAGRSQMAAGFLRHLAGDHVRVGSAGTEPAERIDPTVVAAMAERGIALGARLPTRITDSAVHDSDVVITMGCGDKCPIVPSTRYLDWELDDPSGKALEDVRPIRDEIERLVRAFIEDLGVAVGSDDEAGT